MPDISEKTWIEIDEKNVSPAPRGFPGNMPAYIDTIGRMMMGAIKRSWTRSNPVYETFGEGDAYQVNPVQFVVSVTKYEILNLRAHASNTTTTPTLQFSKASPYPIKKASTSGFVELQAGDIVVGANHKFWFSGDAFILENPSVDAAIGSTALVKTQNLADIPDKPAALLALNAIAGLSGAQYGLAATNTALQNSTALDQIEAASGNVVSIPTGVFDTTKGAYEAVGKTYAGPGRLKMGGYVQAKNRAFILSDPGNPVSADGTQLFDAITDKSESSFTFVGGDVGTDPSLTTYRTIGGAAKEVHYYRYAGGFNRQTGDQSGGRTGVAREIIYLVHDGQGDMGGRLVFGNLSSAKAGATHFLANPALGVSGFQLSASGLAVGGYLQQSEGGYYDNGISVAVVDRVRNYNRSNENNDLGQVWVQDRVQSSGPGFLDCVTSVSGKVRRGFDFTDAEMDGNQAVLNLKAGQRIYFNAVAMPDSAGIRWFATDYGSTYMYYDAAGIRVVVNGKVATMAPTDPTAPILENSWVDSTVEGYGPARYRRNLSGEIVLSGEVKGGLLNSRIFVLPPGMRPANNVAFATKGFLDVTGVAVNPNGEVVATKIQTDGGGSNRVSLDGVTFTPAS